MIKKYFIYTIALFFISLLTGCFGGQSADNSKLEEERRKYQKEAEDEKSKRINAENDLLFAKNNNDSSSKDQKISNLENEITNLKNTENDLNGKINNLENALYSARNNSNSIEIKTLNQELTTLKISENNLKAEITDLKSQLETARSNNNNDQIKELTSQLTKLKNTETNLKAEIKDLKSQLASPTNEPSSNNNQKISTLESQINTLNQEKENLQKNITTKEKELVNLTSTKDKQIAMLTAEIANLKSIARIKDLTDPTKAPDLSKANLDDKATEEIAKTIVSKNLNEIKKLLASSKAPEKVKEAVKKELKEKNYTDYGVNNILYPKITINDKDITAIDQQAKDQLILQLENASEEEKLAFQTTLVNQIEKNNLTNKETLDVFYTVVDLNNQQDKLFSDPKLMPAVKKLMQQANPNEQMNFITRANDNNKVVDLLNNADALGIKKEVIVGDDFVIDSNNKFSLLEYVDWSDNYGVIEAYKKHFSNDDEWQDRLLKTFRHKNSRNYDKQVLDKITRNLSDHNFGPREITDLRKKFEITAELSSFNDTFKNLISSCNLRDIEETIKKAALFLNTQGLKDMALYLVDNLSTFMKKDFAYSLKKIIPFLEKYLDDKDKLNDFKNKLGTISIYNDNPNNFKELNDYNKKELVRQISTANDEEKNNFFDVLTKDISNFNANLVEVIDKLLESDDINKEKTKNIFNNIIDNSIKFTKEKDDIRDRLIETFLKYNVDVSTHYLPILNKKIASLADNVIKNAQSKEDFVSLYNKYNILEHKKHVMNYLYENKDKNKHLEALKELLEQESNIEIIKNIYKDKDKIINLLKNAPNIGLKSNEVVLTKDQWKDKEIINAYRSNFTNEEWKGYLLSLDPTDLIGFGLYYHEFKADKIIEKQELLGITEELLGGFDESYKKLLKDIKDEEDDTGNKKISVLRQIAVFLKTEQDFTNMAEYVVSNEFNNKLVDYFSPYATEELLLFLEKHLKDKSKLDDLVNKLEKHKNTDVYKDIIDLYKNSGLLTDEQKGKLE